MQEGLLIPKDSGCLKNSSVLRPVLGQFHSFISCNPYKVLTGHEVIYSLCVGAKLGSKGTNINESEDSSSISDISNLEIPTCNEEPEAQRSSHLPDVNIDKNPCFSGGR